MICSASLRFSIHSLRIRMTSYPCNKYEQITPSYLLIFLQPINTFVLEGGAWPFNRIPEGGGFTANENPEGGRGKKMLPSTPNVGIFLEQPLGRRLFKK